MYVEVCRAVTRIGLTEAQVNIKVGKTLASAIDKGEEVTEKTKEATKETLGTERCCIEDVDSANLGHVV